MAAQVLTISYATKQHTGRTNIKESNALGAPREFRKVLKVVEVFEQRNSVESAHIHLRNVEDETF